MARHRARSQPCCPEEAQRTPGNFNGSVVVLHCATLHTGYTTLKLQHWRASQDKKVRRSPPILEFSIRSARQLPAQEFVEVHHAILHRRVIWALLVTSLLPKQFSAVVHALADFFIFQSSFVVSLLFGGNEFGLEQ